MSSEPQFRKAFPYQKSVLALPVTDLDAASRWYSAHFGMVEVERVEHPVPTVILERNGTRIGFSINGGDPSQDGAAVLVSNILALKEELERNGAQIGNWRIDEQEGQKCQVFFVVAPDGLCYYFHEPLSQQRDASQAVAADRGQRANSHSVSRGRGTAALDSGDMRDAPFDVLQNVPLENDEANALFAASWQNHKTRDFQRVLARSLAYFVIRHEGRLIGFVNVAWDGGDHAFLLDPTVHPAFRHRGLGRLLLTKAAEAARACGAEWLHVDFAGELEPFYRRAGYRATSAGLLQLMPTASRAV